MQSSRISGQTSENSKVNLSDAELRELTALSLHVLRTAEDDELLNVDTLSKVVQHAMVIVDLLRKDNSIEVYPQLKKRKFNGEEEHLEELEWRAIVSAHLFLAKKGIDLSLNIRQEKAQGLLCWNLTAACYAEGKHTGLLLRFAIACADVTFPEGGDKTNYINVMIAKAVKDAQNDFRMVRYLTAQSLDLPRYAYLQCAELLSATLASIKFLKAVQPSSMFRRANSAPARLQSEVESKQVPGFSS